MATAISADDEMAARIAEHRTRRPDHWQTLEAGESSIALAISGSRAEAVIVDSVTLYVSQLLERESDPMAAMRKEIEDLAACGPDLIVVSDEVGQGVVPSTLAGRSFRDLLGTVNQMMAAVADDVYLIVAGQPLAIKRAGVPPCR